MNYFIAVNYGTSNLIRDWVENIIKLEKEAKFIIVDNFKNEEERKNVINISNKLNIHLILSENIGYGKALNKAIEYCYNKHQKTPFNIFAGNLDIKYIQLPKNLANYNDKIVYVPIIKEASRENRNPFLTNIQKKFIPFYFIAGYMKSTSLFYITLLINKLLGKIPSNIWAVHGSLFCFNSKCIENNKKIFNEESFLYCEEMEFASYMEKNKVSFVKTDIVVIHEGAVATGKINSSKKDFFNLWWPSYLNWCKRWK